MTFTASQVQTSGGATPDASSDNKQPAGAETQDPRDGSGKPLLTPAQSSWAIQLKDWATPDDKQQVAERRGNILS